MTAIQDGAVRSAAAARGVDASGRRLLHRHATAVFLLPAAKAVARVSSGDTLATVARAVEVTRWLVRQAFPTVRPLDVEQPVSVNDHVVTFWVHHPQDGRATDPADLGHLLRRLHELPPPPIPLPEYRPLEQLSQTVAAAETLADDARTWLTEAIAVQRQAFDCLDFPLAHGHIHGDAYPGNILYSGAGAILSDWDETAAGPRELDLANTYQGIRVGRSTADIDRFAHAYGYDLRAWPGLTTLCALRDLHTLGAFIRRSDTGDSTAREELLRRIAVLQSGDTGARWKVVRTSHQ